MHNTTSLPMSTPKLNNHTIEALRNLIDRIAELIFEDVRNYVRNDLSAYRRKPNTVRLREIARETALLDDLSKGDWEALLAAALPQVKEQIDEDDEITSAQTRHLIDGLPEEEPKNVDERYIQHIIQTAAELLKLMMNSDEVSVTSEKLAAKLEFRFGEVPIPNHWKEFVREHRDEIMLQLMQNVSKDLEFVRSKLNGDTDAAEDEDGQADVESQDDLEEMLSIGVGHLVETQGVSQRVQDVLQEIEAKVLADIVVYDPSELKSFNGFGQKSLEELETALLEYGLELGMHIPKGLREGIPKNPSEYLLRKPVTDLDLSMRPQNCFKVATHIETVGDLVRLEADDLLKFRNFGRKALQEVEEVLAELGLHLGMDVDAILECEGEE